MRVRSIKRYDTKEHYAWEILCPGCKHPHHLNHLFDGNVDKPTFTPSVLVTYNGADGGRLLRLTLGKLTFSMGFM